MKGKWAILLVVAVSVIIAVGDYSLHLAFAGTGDDRFWTISRLFAHLGNDSVFFVGVTSFWMGALFGHMFLSFDPVGKGKS